MTLAQEKEWASCSVPDNFFSGCRRAASFPFFGEHNRSSLGVLKARSQSESECLNGLRKYHFSRSKLEALWRLPPGTLAERVSHILEERSDCGSDAESSSSSEECESTCASPLLFNDIEEDIKPQKKVRFADDCGMELFSVKMMNEPSDQPPVLSPSILQRWAGVEETPKKAVSIWKLDFPQPASDYMRFRETLEKGKVALENATISADGQKISGSIKVVNLAFEKRVFIRVTTNHWRSYIDRPATYSTSNGKIHDTFTFDVDLPRQHENAIELQFSVCFATGETEYWDSNAGANYKISLQGPISQRSPFSYTISSSKAHERDDAYKMDSTDWSSFASWRNLSTDGPYW